MNRTRQLLAGSNGRRFRWLPLLVAFVLMIGLVPWSTLTSEAQDSTPTAGAAQVVGEIPNISVAGKTGGTLNMGISFDAATMDPAQTQDNMSLWTEMEVFSRLVRVNNVGTDIEGDLAESLGRFRRWHRIHLPPAAGRQVLGWLPGDGR